MASIKSQILIDLHAYDGCCALSAVEAGWIHVDTQYVHDIYNILYNIKTDYHVVDAFKDL